MYNNEKIKYIRSVGIIVGYVFSYFLFTTILFFILTFSQRLPSGWNYFHIIGITIIITFIGTIIRKLLT